MNKILSFYLSIILVFTIMSTSVGLSIYKHVCNSSGIVETGIGNEDHCCGTQKMGHQEKSCDDESTLVFSSDGCCEFQVKHVNLAVISTIKDKTEILPIFDETFITYIELLHTEENFSQQQFIPNTSPPIPENDIQSLYSVYLI